MTRPKDVQILRELLQKRRRGILEAALGAGNELRALKDQERDPELEEAAQAELADYTLSSLLETQRREIMLIDAALRRMDDGAFGTCVDCELEIPYERLEALPFALRCEEDASRHEQEQRGGQRFVSSSL